MVPIKRRKKVEVDEASCVACGCCVKVCPMTAIEIFHGVSARIDKGKCVGCGKCVKECPASVIELREVQA